MKSDLDVKITSGSAIGIFFILLLAKAGTPDLIKEIPSLMSDSIAIIVTVRYLFVRWLWKWKCFASLEKIHQIPVLEGTWKADVNSTGNANTPPHRLKTQSEFIITQPSIHMIKVRRVSDESKSSSFGETFLHHDDGRIELAYSYLNEPNAEVRDRSPISYGSTKLELVRKSETPDTFNGNYWTDQKTTGTLTIHKV